MNWRQWFCWHKWQVVQVCLRPDDDSTCFVMAWKQCPRCAASKLIHILR